MPSEVGRVSLTPFLDLLTPVNVPERELVESSHLAKDLPFIFFTAARTFSGAGALNMLSLKYDHTRPEYSIPTVDLCLKDYLELNILRNSTKRKAQKTQQTFSYKRNLHLQRKSL